MTLLLATLISGVAVGLLYGLLAFCIVFLFKTTGIANFAMGNMATFATFVVYHLMAFTGMGLVAAASVGLLAAAGFGAFVYLLALRPNDDAGNLNMVVRTLAVYLLLFAVMNRYWAIGQPFAFPSLMPAGSFGIGGTAIPERSIGIIVLALVLSACLLVFFRKTALGLQFLGMAERPDIARLLGVRTRRLTALAWAISGAIALIVGLMVAPTALLSSDMMDLFLLFAFTAAVLGGLTSLAGAFIGGIAVGCITNLAAVYVGQDAASFAVFALLVAVLLIKPDGLFGTPAAVRL